MRIRKWKEMDFYLLGSIFLLFLIGLVLIYSATNNYGANRKIIIQTISFLLGNGALFVILLFDYADLRKWYLHIYVLCFILLLLVYVPGLGSEQFGARSWISLGKTNFQPLEIVKVLFIIAYAEFLVRRIDTLQTLKGVIIASIPPVPIIGMLLLQPDLGGSIVIFSIYLGMIFMANIDVKRFLLLLLVVAIISPLFFYYGLHDYQKERIISFFKPDTISENASRQVNQSMVAIGSGKLLGKGYMNGSQIQYGFLPVTESDFIFPVLGEEFGLIGMIIFLAIYFVFFIRMLLIYHAVDDLFGKLIVTGIFFMFLYQFTQNIGMTIGIMPVTGVTLPFVSYGGSSLISSFISIAFVNNIYINRKNLNF